jgi:hypothetical protein
MTYSPHTEFAKLYKIYTSDPDSMGQHLTGRMARLSDDDPLLVVTGSDVVLFPGSEKPPLVESFRQSTRGFIELASVSHLGTAVAWLVRLRELSDPVWRADAARLVDQIDRTRSINSEALWREEIAVPALAGYESKIADLIDYSCRRVAHEFQVPPRALSRAGGIRRRPGSDQRYDGRHLRAGLPRHCPSNDSMGARPWH